MKIDIVVTVDPEDVGLVEGLIVAMLTLNRVTARVRCLVPPAVTEELESYSTNTVGPES